MGEVRRDNKIIACEYTDRIDQKMDLIDNQEIEFNK